MKTIRYEIKINMTDRINSGLNTVAEKISEPEDIAIDEIKHRKGEMAQKMNRASGWCGTTSSGQVHTA